MYVMPGSLERLGPVGRSWEAGWSLFPVRSNEVWDLGYEHGVWEQEVNSETESRMWRFMSWKWLVMRKKEV